MNFSKRLLLSLTLPALFIGGVIYADATTTSAPTDSQITKIVVTANNAEIDAAKLAKKSTNKDVNELADQMIKAHKKSNTDTEKLARSLDLKMQDSQTSDDLRDDSKQKLADLKKLSGADFDKAYVDGQVAAHETVLKTFDDTLIPSAKDPHLKTLLEKTRTVVQEHLDHAKTLQTAINK